MREILFRGKGLIRPGHYGSGKWTTGYYVQYAYENGEMEHLILKRTVGLDGTYMAKAVVDPETVSQFTGFCDRYGDKIFEGDILKSFYPDDPFEPCTCYEEVFWDDGWYISNYGDRKMVDDLNQNMLNKYSEIAGNIWDNPGLLGVKK